jgi:hypothetical protein
MSHYSGEQAVPEEFAHRDNCWKRTSLILGKNPSITLDGGEVSRYTKKCKLSSNNKLKGVFFICKTLQL